MNEVILKKEREKSLKRRHPWIFSGAIDRVSGNPQKGETIRVKSSSNEFFGYGAYNPDSSIRIRMWTFEEETIDDKFIIEKLRIAINLRNFCIPDMVSNSKRLVFGESDGIPGLIVDKYNDFLVVQFLTAGIENWRECIIRSLANLAGIKNIYERSDLDIRRLEGLLPLKGILSGVEPPESVAIHENGLDYLIDIKNGQKTGFYLDQRENRKIIREYVVDRDVLNCFSYTGGFALNALKAHAKQVTSIDSSEKAIKLGEQNLEINHIDSSKAVWINGDVFKELRNYRDRNVQFDTIIMDPPKFAPTVSQVSAAARGYKDINLLAFKLLKPGGFLITFSCSGGIGRDLFQKIVADAALDAKADSIILEHLSQDKDHPIALNFPESEYLKGLVCQKR
jgi:23S rRNA (cytosine1962-C5)-methyltransferase